VINYFIISGTDSPKMAATVPISPSPLITTQPNGCYSFYQRGWLTKEMIYRTVAHPCTK